MRHPWSIARRVATLQVLLIGLIALFSAWAAYVQARDVAVDLQRRHVLGAARLIAHDEDLVAALDRDDPARALRGQHHEWVADADVSWVTVLSPDGLRLAHEDPDQLGTRYPRPLDSVLSGERLVETSTTGAAGRSVRALVSVHAPGSERVLGVVATGVRVSETEIVLGAQLPRLALAFAAVAAVGVASAAAVSRYLDSVTRGRGPEEMAEHLLLGEAAMDSLEAGLVVLSPAGRPRLFNDTAASMLGWPHGDGEATEAASTDRADLTLPDPLDRLVRDPASAPGLDAGPELDAEPGSSQFTVRVGERMVVARLREIHGVGSRASDRGRLRLLVLHDRTDVQRLAEDLSVSRTLTQALRSQTHEHANRLHTAVSLLESGRPDAAAALLRERGESAASVSPAGSTTDSGALLRSLVDAKRSQAAERGVALHAGMRCLPGGPLEGLDLITVVGNLADNAIDAAASGAPDPHEGRWVDVDVTDGPDGLLVQVADSGPGPSPHAAAHMFEHGWSTKQPAAEGRGIGLALVRAVAREHGGDVELAVDSGTVFTVEVPPRGSAASDEPGGSDA